MAVPGAVSASNHFNVRAGIQRQTENRAAESWSRYLNSQLQVNATGEMQKVLTMKEGHKWKMGTNGLVSQKNGQGERGLEEIEVEEYNFGECGWGL